MVNHLLVVEGELISACREALASGKSKE